MTADPEPTEPLFAPGDIHLPGAGPRRLRLFFYTSSVNKFLQARHVLSRYGYVVEHFQRTDPYGEDYSRGKDALLAAAIKQVTAAVGKNVLFFVEDTSLRIEALSNNEDVPGLAVKEWFAATTFDELNELLNRAGGDRRSTIKSGIALHLPGRGRPVYFYGETQGVVTRSAPTFTASRIHPWLSAETFDGWFIPDGSDKRLGEMGADESLRLHFRARALRDLAERVAEYSAIVNLPPAAYFVRRPASFDPQLALFSEPVNRFLVFGPRAAGKTTFGEFAGSRLGAEHHEASTVIRLYHSELCPEDPDISAFAMKLHAERGDDLVIRALTEQYGLADASLAVVTGLRKFAELLYLASVGVDYQMVYVEASPRTRYDRYVQRAREDSVMSFEAFSAEDETHAAVLRFAREFADVTIQNEYDLDHYLTQVEYVVRGGGPSRPQGLAFRQSHSDDSLLMHSLRVVIAGQTPLTASEVATRLADRGITAATDSVSRILREAPGLFRRVSSSGVVAYEGLPSAADFVELASERARR